MSGRRFEQEIEEILQMPWEPPPQQAKLRARKRPSAHPIPPPPQRARRTRLRPPDVRAHTADADATAMTTHTFPGLGVTLMVTAPEGDALWRVQGRLWLDEPAAQPLLVVLSAGDHVLTVVETPDGGSFQMEEILPNDWSLEFHLPDGRVHLVEGPQS